MDKVSETICSLGVKVSSILTLQLKYKIMNKKMEQKLNLFGVWLGLFLVTFVVLTIIKETL